MDRMPSMGSSPGFDEEPHIALNDGHVVVTPASTRHGTLKSDDSELLTAASSSPTFNAARSAALHPSGRTSPGMPGLLPPSPPHSVAFSQGALPSLCAVCFGCCAVLNALERCLLHAQQAPSAAIRTTRMTLRLCRPPTAALRTSTPVSTSREVCDAALTTSLRPYWPPSQVLCCAACVACATMFHNRHPALCGQENTRKGQGGLHHQAGW